MGLMVYSTVVDTGYNFSSPPDRSFLIGKHAGDILLVKRTAEVFRAQASFPDFFQLCDQEIITSFM